MRLSIYNKTLVLLVSCLFALSHCARSKGQSSSLSLQNQLPVLPKILLPADVWPDALGAWTLGMGEEELEKLPSCSKVRNTTTNNTNTDWICEVQLQGVDTQKVNYGIHLVFHTQKLQKIYLVANRIPSSPIDWKVTVKRFVNFFKQSVSSGTGMKVVYPDGSTVPLKQFSPDLAWEKITSNVSQPGPVVRIMYPEDWRGAAYLEVSQRSISYCLEQRKSPPESTPVTPINSPQTQPQVQESPQIPEIEQETQRISLKTSDFEGLESFPIGLTFPKLMTELKKKFPTARCKLTLGKQYVVCSSLVLKSKGVPLVARFALDGQPGPLRSITFSTAALSEKIFKKKLKFMLDYLKHAVGDVSFADPEESVSDETVIWKRLVLDEGDWEDKEVRIIPARATKGLLPLLFLHRVVIEGKTYYKLSLNINRD